MRFTAPPDYVSKLASWFSGEVATQRAVRAAARRPFREFDETDGPLLVRSGLVAATRVGPSGERQTISLFYPDEMIVPFRTRGRLVLEAILDSELDLAEQSVFDGALAATAGMGSAFNRVMNRDRAIAYEWLARVGLRDSAERLAHLVCETFVRMGAELNAPMLLPFSQAQLAEITAQTSVNVNRMLGKLDRSGLVSREGRAIRVSDWSGLTRLGGFDAAYLTS